MYHRDTVPILLGIYAVLIAIFVLWQLYLKIQEFSA